SARDLVQLMYRHIHPLALSYCRDSTNFPIHPEFILWPIPGEGFLARYLTREMFAYDPGLIELNTQALPSRKIDRGIGHYITDSDDLFALSLAPRLKDIEWYGRSRRLDPFAIASWWIGYDSPQNDATAEQYFYVQGGPRDPAKWRRAERE